MFYIYNFCYFLGFKRFKYKGLNIYIKKRLKLSNWKGKNKEDLTDISNIKAIS